MNWLRKLLVRRELRELYAERDQLVRAIRKIDDVFHPSNGESHTLGTYDGVTRAIRILEGRD